MPFADRTFDTVWASQVVHHIADLPAFALELRRVMKPGGALLLRGGFGPPTDLPLYRYFPQAWSGRSVHPALSVITGHLAEAGLRRTDHASVAQLFAADGEELLEKVRTLAEPARHAARHRLPRRTAATRSRRAGKSLPGTRRRATRPPRIPLGMFDRLTWR
jgi:SAM-dependent methyltransferase